VAKKPVFDFGLGQAPRVRERQEWMEVAQDTRAMGAAALENARILAIDHVEPGPWQVRRDFRTEKMAELVESVRAQGVLEPILVRASEGGRYQIIAGERRYRAALEAGLTTVPALVLEIDDVDARVVSLMENIQRDDLNEMERAEGLVALKQLTGQTWEEIGQRLGVTRRHVLHLVSLTKLPESVQALVREGRLSAKHGRLLSQVKNAEVLSLLAEAVAEFRLTAAQTAEVVKRVGGEPGFTLEEDGGDPDRARASLRDRIDDLIDSVRARGDEPVVAAPSAATTPGDTAALVQALAEMRRALAGFPMGTLTPEAARNLESELDSLIQAADLLRRRVAPTSREG